MVFSQNCLNVGEIYDFVQQQCLKCDDHCNTCSGLTQNDCLTCMNNYYRQGVDNSCQEKCVSGTYINQKTNTCEICSVLGCDQCLQNQRCIKCTENLKLDEQSGCVLNDNTCSQQQYYSLFLKQCFYLCSENEIKDQNTVLCIPIQNCNYFQEIQKNDLFQSVSVETFIDNGFLLIGESLCQFYLYNQNLETVYSNLLVQNPQDKTVFYGQQNFYDRNVGGCQTQQTLIGFNFLTYQIEFNINNELNTQYSLFQLDAENHIIVLQKNQGGFIFFDYLNNEEILIETNNLYIYNFQRKLKCSALFQKRKQNNQI
ncbi:hypothetical protein TTHERM_00414200 (macronuclear) [Tetrahymena thermophila SB210]|uniref:Zinc finger lsd1 subclass family protein n=1 Tax=Tetrahymena thermophila (strain SB210) TaxID=312017 RepID=Q22P66_TETTS|nr:hypothetical protein TTHERM_00414200 [Tetrahymena thermophila SB210]EAR86945.1 hypothetical protein TTHERM_00414200 [Tetrahymena thermophila SB210]|eukprot:XP_001007190.1 hypothetical protein TTHERM_00414200 [Tetrahymena thermophila SB210]